MNELEISRKQAFLGVLPFLLLGLADVVFLLNYGLNPLWGLMILPPILFVSIIGWFAFRSGFTRRNDTGPELGRDRGDYSDDSP